VARFAELRGLFDKVEDGVIVRDCPTKATCQGAGESIALSRVTLGPVRGD